MVSYGKFHHVVKARHVLYVTNKVCLGKAQL